VSMKQRFMAAFLSSPGLPVDITGNPG